MRQPISYCYPLIAMQYGVPHGVFIIILLIFNSRGDKTCCKLTLSKVIKKSPPSQQENDPTESFSKKKTKKCKCSLGGIIVQWRVYFVTCAEPPESCYCIQSRRSIGLDRSWQDSQDSAWKRLTAAQCRINWLIF
jgi:hypothetical protein